MSSHAWNSNKQVSVAEVAKELGQRWKQLTDEQRQEFKDIATRNKQVRVHPHLWMTRVTAWVCAQSLRTKSSEDCNRCARLGAVTPSSAGRAGSGGGCCREWRPGWRCCSSWQRGAALAASGAAPVHREAHHPERQGGGWVGGWTQDTGCWPMSVCSGVLAGACLLTGRWLVPGCPEHARQICDHALPRAARWWFGLYFRGWTPAASCGQGKWGRVATQAHAYRHTHSSSSMFVLMRHIRPRFYAGTR